MTATIQSTKRKLSLLLLADELGNASKTCKIIDCLHDTHYEVRRALRAGGATGLVEQKRGPKKQNPNRVRPEFAERIVAQCLKPPSNCAHCIANELRLQNVGVSPSGVRGVWLRLAASASLWGSPA